MTYDEAVRIAREAAMTLPLIDHGSTEAIHDVARLLIAAYRRGRSDEAYDQARAEDENPG